MFSGVLLVLAACSVWGLIFVIPEVLIAYSPIEVALGRYLCFGLLSFVLMMAQGWQKWRKIPLEIWRKAFLYAFIVNIFYYSLLVLGLRYSNASVIALIQGISPITIAFYGNWREKECNFKRLILPSCLTAVGLILVNIPVFRAETSHSPFEYLIGLLCGMLSLMAWNWYVVANAQFLKQNPTMPSGDWATLIGATTLVWVALIGICVTTFFFLAAQSEVLQKYTQWNEGLKNYLFGVLILGFICSWFGSYLWNQAAKVLPISLAGQLTIFETVFGLIFVYTFEQTFPSFLELTGICIILSGVATSMNYFSFKSSAPTTPAAQMIH